MPKIKIEERLGDNSQIIKCWP